MSVSYTGVGWNPQKKIYDRILGASSLAYLGLFAGLGALIHPSATLETLLIRGLGTLAFLLLHITLAIGPLCRLDRRFLPLLYNRRHLGVLMFLTAAGHGVFSLIQFHAFGDTNPLISVWTSNTRFSSLSQFPFQGLGFAALVILFLMAATSHDFWLHNLGPAVWKRMHMLVYPAYALLVGHVCLGALQDETNPWLAIMVGAGAATMVTLHLTAGLKERRADRHILKAGIDGFVEVGPADTIPDQRAKVITLGAERVAVFRLGDKVSALSNVCRHQNGPLGEGRIIDGCVTCPWHGYQYNPETGMSPPPFNDKVCTFRTKVIAGRVFVHPEAQTSGTYLDRSSV